MATATQWANAVLHNGLGRYEEAYVAAERGCEHPQELGLSTWSTVELVEAAVRSGRHGRAAEAARRLAEMAEACGTDGALGTAASVRAQVSEGSAAEEAYREAIQRLGRAGVGMTLARTHLLYGERLRRDNRRVDARVQLADAYRMLTRMSQIARLAADGLTNPEIGAQLFISPHTVEWHLRKVYVKLGITSRRQLRSALGEDTAATA